MKNEWKILKTVTFLFITAAAGVWLHRAFINVPPWHKLLPLGVMIAAAAVAWWFWLRNISFLEIFKDYFLEKTHPLNLAVFRIVLFSFMYQFLPLEKILFFSRLNQLDL